MTKENKKRETKKGVVLVLALAFAFISLILISGFVSATTTIPTSYCGDNQCSNGETCTSCSCDCGTCQCKIELTKSVNNSNPKPGDIVKYTLHYKNAGNIVCTGGGVRIEDALNSALIYQGSFTKSTINDLDSDGIDAGWYEVPGFDSSTNTLTWNVHRVSPGEEGTITFDVKVPTPSHCGNLQIPNYFRAWSNQEDWKSSNTITLNLNNACPICGDHIINQANETCDDGNTNNDDGCSSDCKIERCGDGIKQGNEQCDDGNIINTDGCRNNCKFPYCGDGVKDSNEECDDNNTINGDGCSSTCHTETKPYCGDHVVNQANETCDDGNLINNDGCSSICKTEVCGDGVKQTNEECDDGNQINDDSCSNTCHTVCLPFCGDGVVNQASEECDDHNNNNGDGCSSDCKIEFSSCQYNISIRYTYANSFGTGIAVNNSETFLWSTETPVHLNQGIHKIRYSVDNFEAEDNNASITVKLDNTQIISYFQNIDSSHYRTLTLDTSNLQCGTYHNITVKVDSEFNNICANDSTSDNFANRTIYIDCNEEHYCGDGSLNSGEECDLGPNNGKMCTPLYGSSCTYCSSKCEEIVLTDGFCGDGLIQPQYEQCDDGNKYSGDGCSSTCQPEEQQQCIENISIRKTYSNSFGTGIAIGYTNGTWISQVSPDLLKGIYQARYYVDNNIANTTNNAHITVKIDSGVVADYYYLISKYHSRTISLDTTGLQCNSMHKISVKVDSQCNFICTQDDTSDNYAERSFFVECPAPICGDGNLDIGEECDDGNNYDNDGCSANCETECLPFCGDSIVQSNEQCDLGTLNGHACTPLYNNSCTYCSSQCTNITLTDGHCGDNVCNGPETCSTCPADCGTCNPICGNGIKEGNEQCDLGNLLNGNVCTPLYNSSCTYCSCSCQNITLTDGSCGDSIVQSQYEQCDKGALNGNVCTPLYGGSCTYCNASCKNITLTDGHCGDSIVQSQYEQCDKGALNGNVCTPLYNSSCTYCSAQCTNITLTDGKCGDSVVQSQYEQCDKGLLNGNVCTPLYGSSCTYCNGACQNITLTGPYCGNGIKEGIEECDDGNTNNTDYCRNNCKFPYCGDGVKDSNEACDDGNTNNMDGCRNNCVLPVCGDSLKDSNEQCDLGLLNGQVCTPLYGSSCTYCNGTCQNITIPGGYCGNGIREATEACDDGNMNNTDGCRNNCVLPVCGDSLKDSNEQCDLGLLNGNVCTPLYNSSCTYCNGTCQNTTIPGGYCGNGIREATEACDDGNMNNTDGCRNNCVLPVCGDSLKDSNEACDDGNLVNNDGCSSTCKIERCGDGVTQTNEQCDDNNLVNNDGCSSTCKIERCGDSIKQSNEQCDDGNTVNTDGCRNNCKLPYCGDGIKDKLEYCDDGNQVNGDGCSKTCRFECPNGICTPNITIEKFPPILWQCDNRVVYDDATKPGRISTDGQTLVERINNYAFEGEQIQWKVLVMDKNGIEKVRDVYATVGGSIEANCHLDHILMPNETIDTTCNARIGEETLTKMTGENVAAYYTCTLTVETPESMYGESDVTVEAIDMDGEIGTMAEGESWFLNPTISLGVEGSMNFTSLRPGTSEYSDLITITNNAEAGSGVLLDTFISGTDFYDTASSGAKCGLSNQLKLNNFAYHATNGEYSTNQDMEVGRSCDSEGYCGINYGIGFNNPNPFYNKNEIIQAQKVGPYYIGNLLAPGADMSLTLRLNVPEPCNGNFDSGHIYFWGEAV